MRHYTRLVLLTLLGSIGATVNAGELVICNDPEETVHYLMFEDSFAPTAANEMASYQDGLATFPDGSLHGRVVHEISANMVYALCGAEYKMALKTLGLSPVELEGELNAIYDAEENRVGTEWHDENNDGEGGSLSLAQKYYYCDGSKGQIIMILNTSYFGSSLDGDGMTGVSDATKEGEWFRPIRERLEAVEEDYFADYAAATSMSCNPLSKSDAVAWQAEYGTESPYLFFLNGDPGAGVWDTLMP